MTSAVHCRWVLMICALVCSASLPTDLLADPPIPSDTAAVNPTYTGFTSADFLQTRHVKALERPLVSSGSLELTEVGFIWAQQTPFQNTLAFDGETVVEQTRMGDRLITRPLQDPVTTQITRTLFNMMQGSWADIRASFHIIEENEGDSVWTRRLIPIDPAIRQLIPEIKLSGTRFLENIELRQDEDTHTLIELSEHRPAE